ncbi:MAG: DUF1566 domain-containing protein [Alphaproteobacteria bacterium]
MPSIAHAELQGTFVAAGDSCAGLPEGATAVTADPDQSRRQIILICNGTVWEAKLPSFSNQANCEHGMHITFNASTGGLRCGDLDPPCHTQPVGTVCDDGTIYAGNSPDGNVPMFTTPADVGQFQWSSASVETGMGYCWQVPAVCVQGQSNTSYLQGLHGNPNLYQAAHACFSLSAHGHDDWYLPARQEMEVLQANRGQGALDGSFSGVNYWTSSEQWQSAAYYVDITNGTGGDGTPNFSNWVRCVRR